MAWSGLRASPFLLGEWEPVATRAAGSPSQDAEYGLGQVAQALCAVSFLYQRTGYVGCSVGEPQKHLGSGSQFLCTHYLLGAEGPEMGGGGTLGDLIAHWGQVPQLEWMGCWLLRLAQNPESGSLPEVKRWDF